MFDFFWLFLLLLRNASCSTLRITMKMCFFFFFIFYAYLSLYLGWASPQMPNVREFTRGACETNAQWAYGRICAREYEAKWLTAHSFIDKIDTFSHSPALSDQRRPTITIGQRIPLNSNCHMHARDEKRIPNVFEVTYRRFFSGKLKCNFFGLSLYRAARIGMLPNLACYLSHSVLFRWLPRLVQPQTARTHTHTPTNCTECRVIERRVCAVRPPKSLHRTNRLVYLFILWH